MASKEVELVIKNISTKKRRGPDGFTGPPIIPKLFQKTEEEGLLSDSFYKVSIILISKSDKKIKKKKIKTNIPCKNLQQNIS